MNRSMLSRAPAADADGEVVGDAVAPLDPSSRPWALKPAMALTPQALLWSSLQSCAGGAGSPLAETAPVARAGTLGLVLALL